MINDSVELLSQVAPEMELPLPPISMEIVLAAVPGIALIWIVIWLTFGMLTWSVSSLLHAGNLGYFIIGGATLVPTVWSSYQIVRLAIAGERELAAETR